ncbi:MAG: anti-sigma factor family protein, partial [Planctomycetota bacterium JB042]
MSRSADDLARLHDLIDGRLPPDEARALETRIAADERLRRRYGELKLVVSGLAEFADERAPSDFADRVLAAVDETGASPGPSPEAAARPWTLRLVGRSSAVAAACAAVLTVGILLSSREGALAPRGAVEGEAPAVGLADRAAPPDEKSDAWTQGDGEARLGRLGEAADRSAENARSEGGERRRQEEESEARPVRSSRERQELAKSEGRVPPPGLPVEAESSLEAREEGAAEDVLERAARGAAKGAPPAPVTLHLEEAEADAEVELDADDRAARAVRQVLRQLPLPGEPASPASEVVGEAGAPPERLDEVLRRLRDVRSADADEPAAAGKAAPTIVRFAPAAGFAGRASTDDGEGANGEWDRLLAGVGHDVRPLESLAAILPASERDEAAARLRADAGDRIRLVEVDAADLPRLVANASSLGLVAEGLAGSVPSTGPGAVAVGGGPAFLTGTGRRAGPTGPGDGTPESTEAKAKRKSGPTSGVGSKSGPAREAKEAADDAGPARDAESSGAAARVVLILVRERPGDRKSV